VFGLLLLSAQAATAGEPITISSKIPYDSDGVGNAAMREHCRWDTEVPAWIVAHAKGTVVSTKKDLSTITSPKLIITIANVDVGGGPRAKRSAIMRGELIEDGKTQGTFFLRRVSGTGKFRVCGALDTIGQALAHDILEWLNKRTVNATPGG